MDILPEITDLFFMAVNDTESHLLDDLFILLLLGLFLLLGASLTLLTHLEQVRSASSHEPLNRFGSPIFS